MTVLLRRRPRGEAGDDCRTSGTMPLAMPNPHSGLREVKRNSDNASLLLVALTRKLCARVRNRALPTTLSSGCRYRFKSWSFPKIRSPAGHDFLFYTYPDRVPALRIVLFSLELPTTPKHRPLQCHNEGRQ